MRYLEEASKRLDQFIRQKTKLANIPGMVAPVADCDKLLRAMPKKCI